MKYKFNIIVDEIHFGSKEEAENLLRDALIRYWGEDYVNTNIPLVFVETFNEVKEQSIQSITETSITNTLEAWSHIILKNKKR